MGSRVDQRATLGGPHEVARPKIPVHAARAFCAAARTPIERAARGGLDHLLERRERHLRPLTFRLRETRRSRAAPLPASPSHAPPAAASIISSTGASGTCAR